VSAVGSTTRPASQSVTAWRLGTTAVERKSHVCRTSSDRYGKERECTAPRERLCVKFRGRQSPSGCRRRLFRGGAVATCSACSMAKPQTLCPKSAATACSARGVLARRVGQRRTMTLAQALEAECWPDDGSLPLVDHVGGALPLAFVPRSKGRPRPCRHRRAPAQPPRASVSRAPSRCANRYRRSCQRASSTASEVRVPSASSHV
jgi:hypothetical protein